MSIHPLHAVESPPEIPACDTDLFLRGSAFAPVQRGDIQGIDSAMRSVDRIATSLTNYRSIAAYGATVHSGAVFYGPPGTGKTLAARYLATVTDSLFVDVNEFFRLEGECSAKTVHQLFSLAADASRASDRPVILFWDEFSYDRKGCVVSDHTRDVVNQLLTELSGAVGRPHGILLLACTNYLDSIDDALLRSGRLGEHVPFASPDAAGRAVLIEHYASRLPVEEGVDYLLVADVMHGDLSAAGCERVVEVAWRSVVLGAIDRDDDPVLEMAQLIDAALGTDALDDAADECENGVGHENGRRIAVHEAGHALVAHALGVPVVYATAWGGSGYTRTRAGGGEDYIVVGVAGVAATDALGLERGLGHTADLDSVTEGAKRLVDTAGVGASTGFVNLLSLQSHPHPGETGRIADATLADRDADVRAIIEAGRIRATAIITENVAALEALAVALQPRVRLLRPEITAILEEHGVAFGCEKTAVFGDGPARHR